MESIITEKLFIQNDAAIVTDMRHHIFEDHLVINDVELSRAFDKMFTKEEFLEMCKEYREVYGEDYSDINIKLDAFMEVISNENSNN
jgi:hypothetical protein